MIQPAPSQPRPRLRLVLGLVAAAVLLAPAAAGAAERWAEPGGDGPAATCPEADPCDLDTAVEHASVVDGDEVVVKPGTYDVASIEVGDAIDLHGQSPVARPTINTTATYGFFISDSATIRALEVNASESSAVAVQGGNPLIEQVSATTTRPGGIACNVWGSATIRDTVCWGNATNTRGIGANAGVPAGERLIRLRNVTAAGTTSGIDFGFSGPGVTVTVDARNVIADGDYDVIASGQSGATTTVELEHSNFARVAQVGGGSVPDPGTGTNQTGPPVFVDPAAGDFHQQPESPTVDAGALDAFTGDGDVDGDARSLDGDGECPDAPVPDIGADEHASGPIDCEAPETSIEGGPDGVTSDATPTFGLGSTEDGTFECSLDQEEFAPCSTPYTTEPLEDGEHALRVRAINESGNVDPTPAERSFAVRVPVDDGLDADPPETAITSAPKRVVRTKRKRARVAFGFGADEAASFACSLDGKPFAPCASPLKLRAGLGRHSLRVRATDRAGNVDESPATVAFKVKRKRPRR